MKVGIFQMSEEDYFAAHGISQSSLKKLARSPAHLKYHLEHPEPSTPDQVAGRVFHKSVFEPDQLETCVHVKPLTYEDDKGAKKKWNGNATFCRDWISARQDKPIIGQSDFSDILVMRDSVMAHPAAALALKTGKAEQSLFCEDPDTGLQLKARLDWLTGNTIVDLKKCQDASPSGFARTIAAYGYEVQNAFYEHVCSILGIGMQHMIFVCTESEAPFCTAVYELDPESIEDGRSKYRRYLRQYLECVVADKWPAYSQNVEFISLPQYARFAERNAQLLEDRPPMPALEVAP